MIAAGIGKSHATCDGIMECREFSVNIPAGEMLVKTDYAGIVSGKKVNKSAVFEIFYGELKSAPMVAGAIVSLECRLIRPVELPTNTLFIGEIVGAWSEPRFLEGDVVKYAESGAYFLTMPDNRYWSFGEAIGKAWSDGKELLK
jgi:flavin reductase (DIM6/NTAB) family NADH-FMN oxidoreductase RutF